MIPDSDASETPSAEGLDAGAGSRLSDTPETDANREIWLVKTPLELGDGRPINGNVVDVEFARALERENTMLRELASISYELASYANESLPTNQPEFLEGLFERIEAFEKAHTAIFAPENAKSDAPT